MLYDDASAKYPNTVGKDKNAITVRYQVSNQIKSNHNKTNFDLIWFEVCRRCKVEHFRHYINFNPIDFSVIADCEQCVLYIYDYKS